MSKHQLDELKNLIEHLFIDSVAMKLKNQSITIGILSRKGKEALQSISGLDFKEEIRFCLHSGDLRHIYQHHYGSNESPTSGLSPLDMEDIRCVAEILVHPDEIIYLGDDGKGKKFAFLMEKDRGLLTVIEVYAQKKAKLTVKTFYNSKIGKQGLYLINPTRSMVLDTPSHTSETVLGLDKGPSTSNAPAALDSTSETIAATLSSANIPILLESK